MGLWLLPSESISDDGLCFRLGSNPQTGCTNCACHEAGTVGTASTGVRCNKISGQCPCKSNVEGRSCNRCRSNTYNLTIDHVDGCQPCDCDSTGTSSTSGVGPDSVACDQNTGECSCLSNRVGRRCDTCAPGEGLPLYLTYLLLFIAVI